jgi:hypothetical protein
MDTYAANNAEQISTKDDDRYFSESNAGTNQSIKYVKKLAFNSPKFADVHSQYKCVSLRFVHTLSEANTLFAFV